MGSVNLDKPSRLFGMSNAIVFRSPSFRPYASAGESRRRMSLSAILEMMVDPDSFLRRWAFTRCRIVILLIYFLLSRITAVCKAVTA
jgi:hypothetical protein